jgi:hypothetical protein
MERKTTSRPRRRRTTKTAVPVEVVPASPALLPLPVAEPELSLSIVAPEPVFVTRVPPPAPERLRPTTRHAIFFDVENTSNPSHIERVVGRLAIDHIGRSTEFFAVGNWRVIGHETGRVLARFGAQLLHSAPSTGVRDWSDLRIAVSAGVWLAGARPGDVLEIVSDDRAFDAVGDVAAALGITFHRLSARSLTAAAPVESSRPAPAADRDRGRRRGRRGGRSGRSGRQGGADAEPRRVETARHTPAPALVEPGEAQSAPHDELVLVVRELADRSPNGAVLIDNVARTLKARGFSRPPGSPRLVTRLRRIKELSVSPTGMISLVPDAIVGTEEPAPPPAPPVEDVVEVETEAAPTPAAAPRRGRRRSRRGGRGRRRSSQAAGA